MLKRVLTLILAFAMVIANGTYVLANTLPALLIKTITTAEKGQSFNVDLYLEAPQDIKTLEFKLYYDPEVLILNTSSFTAGSEMSQWIYEYNMFTQDGVVSFAAVDEEGFNQSNSVKVATLQFNVKSGASIGNTTLALKEVRSYTDEKTSVEMETANGYINVVSPSTSGGSSSSTVTKPITVVSNVHKVTATVNEEGTQIASVPENIMNQLAEKEEAVLTIQGDLAHVTLNQAALKALIAQGGEGNLEVSVKQAAQEGGYPAYTISMQKGDQLVNHLGNGSVKVEVAYESQGEDSAAVVVYRKQADGSLQLIKKSSYSEPVLSFNTNILGEVVVAYNKRTFADVNRSAWYADFVTYLSAREIMNGKSEDAFDPSASITRAEFVQLLANLEEVTQVTPSNDFADVNASAWYAESVAWAAAQGIATGYEGQFNPSAPITRQEIAVMLTRYCEKVAGITLEKSEEKVTFKDQNAIADYALEAVTTLQQAGIIAGKGEQIFAPKDQATRAEVAKMMTVLVRDNM